MGSGLLSEDLLEVVNTQPFCLQSQYLDTHKMSFLGITKCFAGFKTNFFLFNLLLK